MRTAEATSSMGAERAAVRDIRLNEQFRVTSEERLWSWLPIPVSVVLEVLLIEYSSWLGTVDHVCRATPRGGFLVATRLQYLENSDVKPRLLA